jgi:steroid delta-isomerase-like uncharacterized protein
MQAPTPAKEHTDKVRRVIEEFYNQGRLGVADELYAHDYARYDPATPDVVGGPDGARQVATRYRNAFPDLHLAVKDMLAEGDKVTTRWTASGTHKGDLQGIAPTGNSMEISGLTIMRFTGGKIVEEWTNWDTLGMMKQLGIISQ